MAWRRVWVDDDPPMKVDAFMPSSAGWYGPAAQYYLVAQGLPMTTHTLHVKIIEEKHPETGDNTNHLFELANVFADGALVDNLDDWSYVYSHAGDFEFDFQHVDKVEGDRSRVSSTGESPGEIVWHYRDFTDFEATLYYPPGDEVEHNVFCISADGLNWTLASPTVEGGEGDWIKYVYSLSGLSGVSYIKTMWMNTEASPAPQLSRVTITRADK
ncbi:MAG: hypothetical protein JXB30_03080 [Anaerolineae bacterium]|nr:hypothetical protein [Anaerolineae bacterium]